MAAERIGKLSDPTGYSEDVEYIVNTSRLPIAPDENLRRTGAGLCKFSHKKDAAVTVLPDAISYANDAMSNKGVIYFAYSNDQASFEGAKTEVEVLISSQRLAEVTEVNDFTLTDDHKVARIRFREIHPGSLRISSFRRRKPGASFEIGLRFAKQYTPAEVYICDSPEMAKALQVEFFNGNLYPVPAILDAGKRITV